MSLVNDMLIDLDQRDAQPRSGVPLHGERGVGAVGRRRQFARLVLPGTLILLLGLGLVVAVLTVPGDFAQAPTPRVGQLLLPPQRAQIRDSLSEDEVDSRAVETVEAGTGRSNADMASVTEPPVRKPPPVAQERVPPPAEPAPIVEDGPATAGVASQLAARVTTDGGTAVPPAAGSRMAVQGKGGKSTSHENREPRRQAVRKQASPSALSAATALAGRGETGAAIGLLERILEDRQATPAEVELLAQLLVRQGELSQAARRLQAGHEASPRHGGLAMLLARVLVELDEGEQALAVLGRFESSADAEMLGLMAAIEQRAGLHAEAIAHYRSALLALEDRGEWWVGLGISLEARGETGEAMKAYRRAGSEPGLQPALRRFVQTRLDAGGEVVARPSS